MCGSFDKPREPYLRPAPEKALDSRGRHAYYVWEVKASIREIEPDELFRMRHSIGMTQADFGQFLGVTVMTVSRWERGITRCNPYMSYFIRSRVKEHKEKFSSDGNGRGRS